MPTKAAFFATGNNLVFQGDITRRALVCSLDPECERPEKRTFANNPREVAKRNRAALLHNALTILRAFHVAGRPQPEASVPFGGFEVWSQLVRGALLWLQQADPVQTVEKTRASDPKLEAKLAVISQWREVIGVESEASVKEVISIATEPKRRGYPDNRSASIAPLSPNAFLNDDFREALLAVAGIRGSISSGSLGKWLAANVNRVFRLNEENGKKSEPFRFVKLDKARHGVAIWKLEKVSR